MENKIWIDYTKAFCMFLVYINHTEIYYGYNIPYAETIYRPFFVNLFFIVSGYLLFRKYLSTPYSTMEFKTWNDYVKKNYIPNTFFKLAVPTILFALINYFPKKIIRHEPIDINSLFMDTIGGGSLWFTSAMVIAQVIICLILYKKRSIWFYFIVSLLLAHCAKILANIDLIIFQSPSFPWFYKSGMIAVLFMVIGGLYWKYEEFLSYYLNKHKWILPLMIITYCVFILKKDFANCNTINADINIWGVFSTCLASLVIIYIFKLFKKSDAISFIGRNSICFYFLSGAIPNIVAIISKKMIHHPNSIAVLTLAVISFGVAWIVVKILIHFTPFLFDLRKLHK